MVTRIKELIYIDKENKEIKFKTVKEAAAYIKCGSAAIYGRISRGSITAIRETELKSEYTPEKYQEKKEEKREALKQQLQQQLQKV